MTTQANCLHTHMAAAPKPPRHNLNHLVRIRQNRRWMAIICVPCGCRIPFHLASALLIAALDDGALSAQLTSAMDFAFGIESACSFFRPRASVMRRTSGEPKQRHLRPWASIPRNATFQFAVSEATPVDVIAAILDTQALAAAWRRRCSHTRLGFCMVEETAAQAGVHQHSPPPRIQEGLPHGPGGSTNEHDVHMGRPCRP